MATSLACDKGRHQVTGCRGGDRRGQEEGAAVGSHRLVEVMAHRVSQSADGVVEDEQVFVLVLAEGEDEGV